MNTLHTTRSTHTDGPHNALRSDMAKLGKALDALTTKQQPGEASIAIPDNDTCANLKLFYDDFTHLVHMHHDIEEKVFIR